MSAALSDILVDSEWIDVARTLRSVQGSAGLVARSLANLVEAHHYTAQQAATIAHSGANGEHFRVEYQFVLGVLKRSFGVVPGALKPLVVPTQYDRGRRDMAQEILDRLATLPGDPALEAIRSDLRAVLR